MEFFLPFHIKPFPFKISYSDKILFIGSCFSEEIGNKMHELKFDVLQNPNGILYDPVSITDALFSYIEKETFREEDLFELNGLWHSWKHHSAFSGIDKIKVLATINKSQNEAHLFLKEAKVLIITFGTAFNYQLRENLNNVANCHKAPSNIFIKTLLPAEQIKADLLSVITALELFNPELKIILTVSPVKHIKDGIEENSRNKARLIEAAHNVVEKKENVFYFPAYELVNDVLRDYRFYKSDLVHPNETAVEFVFEKFASTFFDEQTLKIQKELKKIISAFHHKPFVPDSEAHKKFLQKQLQNIYEFQNAYPFINLSAEKEYFLKQAN